MQIKHQDSVIEELRTKSLLQFVQRNQSITWLRLQQWALLRAQCFQREVLLARKAAINEATNAHNPSTTTAANVTMGSYGFMP